MTPLTLFNRLQKTKTKEEFIKVLRDHRPIDEYKCDKKRRYNLNDEL